MHSISKGFIDQANNIPGYSARTLLADMLEGVFEPITYAEAARLAGITRNHIGVLVHHGVWQKYGQGRMVRLNRFEIIKWFMDRKQGAAGS